MVELCGARARAGHDRRRRRAAAAARRSRLRERARARRSSACRSPRERQAEILARARLRDASRADDGLDVTVPALRRDDVTREADLIEEVARIDGLERAARDAARAARRGRAARPTPSACAARAEDALVGRGLHEIVGWSFAEPGAARPAAAARRAPDAPRRARSRTRCRRTSRSCARRCSARCSTPPRHNVARNGPDVAIFESGTVYRAAAGGGDAPRPTSTTRLGVLLSGALDAALAGAASAGEADFFAAKALLEALLDALRVRLVASQPTHAAVPAPGPQRRGARRRASRSAGSASCTRSSPARGTSSARPRSRSTSASSPPPRPRSSRFADVRRRSRRCARTSP